MMKSKLYLLLILLPLGVCTKLKAQEFKTDASFKSQVIPGAIYAPPKQINPVKSKGFEGSSLAKQIREGKQVGMQYNFSPVNPPKNHVTPGIEKTGVPSDNRSSSETDKIVKETETSVPKLPNQTEKQGEKNN
jgi:hypothetical protein